MYYREDELEDVWYKGKEIYMPHGRNLKKGKPESYEGWVWSEEEPIGYSEWVIRMKEEIDLI